MWTPFVGGETYGRLLRDPFAVKARYRYEHVQDVATPTMRVLNIREEIFRNQKTNHEIHENIVPRKSGLKLELYAI